MTDPHSAPEAHDVSVTPNPETDRTRDADALANAVRLLPDASPSKVHLLEELSALLQQLGRHDEAIVALRHAAGLAPADPKYMNELGVTYYRLGKLDDALTSLATAIELLRHDPACHHVVFRNRMKVWEAAAGRLSGADAEKMLQLRELDRKTSLERPPVNPRGLSRITEANTGVAMFSADETTSDTHSPAEASVTPPSGTTPGCSHESVVSELGVYLFVCLPLVLLISFPLGLAAYQMGGALGVVLFGAGAAAICLLLVGREFRWCPQCGRLVTGASTTATTSPSPTLAPAPSPVARVALAGVNVQSPALKWYTGIGVTWLVGSVVWWNLKTGHGWVPIAAGAVMALWVLWLGNRRKCLKCGVAFARVWVHDEVLNEREGWAERTVTRVHRDTHGNRVGESSGRVPVPVLWVLTRHDYVCRCCSHPWSERSEREYRTG